METATKPTAATEMPTRTESTALATSQPKSSAIANLRFEPQTFAELQTLATMVFDAGLSPNSIKGPKSASVIIIAGAELGLSIMQSVQNIFIVNGKTAMYTALAKALCEQSPHCEFIEVTESTNEKCIVQAKRKSGRAMRTFTFTLEDKERAQLGRNKEGKLDPQSPWQKYPRNMLKWRAISEAIAELFPDVTRGIGSVEMERDREEVDVTPVRDQVILPTAPKPAAAEKTVTVEKTPAPREEQTPRATEPPEDVETTPANDEPAMIDDSPATPAKSIATQIAAITKPSEITAVRDQIVAAFSAGEINDAHLRALVVLALGKCSTAADRNGLTQIILALRTAGKITQETIDYLRGEFEKAKAAK